MSENTVLPIIGIDNFCGNVKFRVKFISMEYADYIVRSRFLKVVLTYLFSTSENHRKTIVSYK